MKLLKELLQQIHDGELSFSSENESLESLREFQPIVIRLKSAHEKQYVSKLKHSKSYRVAGGLVSAVLIRGGLTFEGEQFLLGNDLVKSSTQNTEDIVDIKPNIFGVGINFNAIYKKWFKKVNKK